MLSFKKLCLFISFLVSFSFIGIGQSYQDEYLQKSHDTKSFDKEQWRELKGTVKPENSEKTDNFGNSESNIDSETFNFETEDSDLPEGDNYDYEYEDYNDEYSDSDPSDPYDNTDYQRNDSYQKDRNIKSYDHYEKQRNSASPSKVRRNSKRRKNKKEDTGNEGISFLQVIMWTVIIIGLAFLIYYFFINGEFNETGSKISPDFEDLPPSEIPKTELERRLEAALKKNNFREAIRIYFLFTIKDLSAKNWITWEKEKTNISYIYEMKGKEQYHQFNEAVNIYDQVWYGKIEISEQQFLSIEPKYKSLLTAINSK